jgi:hypothetical protein
MNLFEVVNNNVEFSPQALMIKCFKRIWDEDKKDDKLQAVKELSLVYYMADERSDYMYLLDKDERADQICLDLDFKKDWLRKAYINEAIAYYKRASTTTSTLLLESTRNVIQKISKYLDNLNMEERDHRTNKPIHDISKITASVEKIPKLVKALNEIEKEIVKEKEMKAQSGTKDIGMGDTNDGF